MKRYYLFILLLIVAKSASAQVNKLEELPMPVLKQKLAESKSDTSKVQLQLALGRAILFKSGGGNKEIDSAMTFAAQAAKLSNQLSYNDGIINSMLLSALSFNKKNNPDMGFKIAQQALAFAKKINDSVGMAECYIIIGQHYDIGTPEGIQKRINYYNNAIVIFRKEQDMLRLASTLKDQAELFFLSDQQTGAIKLLFEALNVNKAIGYKRVEGIYWLIGRTSIELGDFTSALKYDFLAIKTANEVRDTSLQLCSIYNTTADTYFAMKDYRRATYFSLKALEIAKHYNNKSYILAVTLQLADSYAEVNRLDKTLILLEGIDMSSSNNNAKLLIALHFLLDLNSARQFRQAEIYAKKTRLLLDSVSPEKYNIVLSAYSNLADYYIATRQIHPAYFYTDKFAKTVSEINYPLGIYTAEKDYYQLDSLKGDFKSAMKHYLISQRIKDSLDNVTKAYQISMLQTENDTEEKNNDIDALNKQAQVKDIALKRNRLIQRVIIAGSVLLLIITGLIYSRYRLKKRSNVLLMQQKFEIDEQNVSLQHLVHDKNLLIGDKDELLYEKDLLLKEVNHRVKNNLQIVMSLLESQSGYMQNKKAQEAILESQNRVQSIALIHDQLFNTDKIAEIDLASYIRELVDSLDYSINKGSDKVKINCNVDDILLDVSQAIPVGIILNESVTNALKYAFPGDRVGEINISVERVNEHVEIRISDNGVGLPTDFNVVKANSLGITLMKGLTNQLKGTMNIDRIAGVTVAVKFAVEMVASKLSF